LLQVITIFKKGIHSFVLFWNDAALGPIGYFEYPGYVLLLAGAWQCLIESGGLLVDGIDGVERFLWILKAVLEPCLIGSRRRNFKAAKLQFLRTIQTQELVDSAVRCFRTGWLPHV